MIANLFLAFGLVLIVEGLAYALAPSLIERMLEMLRLMAEDQRRVIGLIAITAGVVLVWAAKMLGA